jgi:hypothetical protein
MKVIETEEKDKPNYQKLFSTKQISIEAEHKPYTLSMSPRKKKLDQNTLKSLHFLSHPRDISSNENGKLFNKE